MQLGDMFERKDWLNALDLQERVSLVLEWNFYKENTTSKSLYSEWRNQKPFNDPKVFERKMDSLSISKEKFRCLVLETPKLDLDKADFAWLEILKESFSSFSKTDINSDYFADNHLLMEYMEICAPAKPIIARALLNFKQKCTESFNNPAAFTTDGAIKAFFPLLLNNLNVLMDKVFVHEMYLAKKEGWLTGDTPEARYGCFVNLFSQPEFSVLILRQYPVLARQIVSVINNWSNFCFEFLTALNKDYPVLQKTFSSDRALGELDFFKEVDGDTHNSGRCVLVATFKGGTSVVYKPRSLNVDVKFRSLTNFINGATGFDIKTPLVIDFKEYGWVEYVFSKKCNSQNEVELYYRRFGRLTALLYCLQTTDAHNGNLIAAGSQPILIDLETLFRPAIARPSIKKMEYLDRYSLLGSGLIPAIDYDYGDDSGYDVSALGGIGGQEADGMWWENRRTDEMKCVNEAITTSDCDNLVKYNGKVVNPFNRLNEIVEGFSELYLFLIKNKETLLKREGLLHDFSTCEVRSVLRHTASYESLLYNMFHPNSLMNALEQDKRLDALWVSLNTLPNIEDIATEEIFDLKSGNIPIFKATASGKHIYSSNKAIKQSLLRSPLSGVRARVEKLDEADLKKQIKTIKDSFALFKQHQTIQDLYASRC